MNYTHLDQFSLAVTLESPCGESEVYRSDDIEDLCNLTTPQSE
ncbi:hypothetical protein [Novipirellula aureliae]|nr:hypothetical protein [Novipirellula aureliae]